MMRIFFFVYIHLFGISYLNQRFFRWTKYNVKQSLSSTSSGGNDLNTYHTKGSGNRNNKQYQRSTKRSVTRARFNKYKSIQLKNQNLSRSSSAIVDYLEQKLQICNSACSSSDRLDWNNTYTGVNNLNTRHSRDSYSLSQEEVDYILLLLNSQCCALSGQSFSFVCNLLGKLPFPSSVLPIISAPLIYYLRCCRDTGSLYELSIFDLISMLKGLARLRVHLTAIYSTLDQRSNNATADEAPLLLQALKSALDGADLLDGSQLSDLMWALCSMRASWTQLSSATRQAFLRHLDAAPITQSSSISAYHLSSLQYSCAKMGMRWRDLPSSTAVSLLRLRYLNSFAFTPAQASKLLWAIGSFGVPKGELPREIVELLLHQAISLPDSGVHEEEFVGPALSQSESQALVGLLRSGAEWTALSSSSQRLVQRLLVRLCACEWDWSGPGDRSLSCAVWVAGSMSIPVHSLSPVLRTALLNSAERMLHRDLSVGMDSDAEGKVKVNSARMLCNTLWGLAKSGFRWDDLSTSLQEAISESVYNLRSTMNSADVGMLLWSLGELDTPLDSLPPRFLDSVTFAANNQLETMKGEHVARFLWGLSRVGVSWAKLSAVSQKLISRALLMSSQQMSMQELANSCYALCILSFDAYIPPGPAAALSRPSSRRQRHPGENDVVIGTVSLDEDPALPGPMNSFLFLQTAFQSLLSELNTLNFSLEGSLHTCSMEELEQFRIFANYLAVMKIVPNPDLIPAELLRSASSTSTAVIPHTAVHMSALHERVVKGLSAAFDEEESVRNQYQVRVEGSSFGGIFPVDITILNRGQEGSSVGVSLGRGLDDEDDVVAFLEVDGPTHYRWDGQLRRKDKLKEAMYLARHPESSFYRVRWDEEDKVGYEVVGRELAAALLEDRKRKKKGPADWAGKAVGNFMQWLLR